jgi:pimeloyl-ACP methyl ester carboxylesterase
LRIPATVPAIHDRLIETNAGAMFARLWWNRPDLEGAPSPLLLFHDSLGCVDLWRGFPEALSAATDRPVIAHDRIGFGRSDPYPGELPSDFISMEATSSVPLLQRDFGFATFVACGHSVGGGMAIETAARLPKDCLAVATMGAQAFVEERTLAGIRLAKAGFTGPEGLARLERYHGDKARWVVDAWTETWLSPAFAGWTLDTALARVTCPVLAIHGEDDEFGSAAHPHRISAGRGQAELLSGVGHNPHREAEGTVLELIRTFLQDLPRP